jgi:hypothetical protein
MPILELRGFLQLHGLGDITTASSALKSVKTDLQMRVSVSCALSKVMILSSSMRTAAAAVVNKDLIGKSILKL